MSLKLDFVDRASVEGANMSGLCREFGISRQTGHKWLRRFRERGFDGLEELSRRPSGTPLATAEDVIVAILELREAHPQWGARKFVRLLAKKFPSSPPSERTIARVLSRCGLVRRRRARRARDVVARAPDVVVNAPNDVWTIDFKGRWNTQDGSRFEPLTVRDACSRFVLAATMLQPSTGEKVRRVMTRLFAKHGIPRAIQCDNGTPFISTVARGGLTQLSAWWISLGIQLVRSRLGCPQDNGGHERMHADIAQELEAFPERDRIRQQRACDRWRHEFNHVRPHDALRGNTPAEVYRSAPCRLHIKRPIYPNRCVVRSVSASGHCCVQRHRVYVSSALAGHKVALEPADGLLWRVWFYDLDLGTVEIVPSSSQLDSVAERLASRSIAA